jgi:hypothetical protein
MNTKEQLLELERKISLGLEKAYIKMMAMKRYKDSPVVFSKGNTIFEADPNRYIPSYQDYSIINESDENKYINKQKPK